MPQSLFRLVDLDRLRRWMADQGITDGPIVEVARMAGGTQNVLLRIRTPDREVVLRRPPEHPRARSNETIRREIQVLGALRGTAVPHATLVAGCDDESVLGVCFYLMEPVVGFNPVAERPEPYASDHGAQRDVALSVVEALARVGRVNVAARGLEGFGRPAGWLERQVGRWRDRLHGYDLQPGTARDAGDLARWLERHRPRVWEPGLIHGDYHLANVMIGPDSGQVAAIVDWELATLGDPLLDLGHLLATWTDPDEDATAASVLHLPGFPSRSELVTVYAEHSDRDVSRVDWYRALACYRLAVLLWGTTARAYQGRASPALGERMDQKARALIRQGLELATSS